MNLRSLSHDSLTCFQASFHTRFRTLSSDRAAGTLVSDFLNQGEGKSTFLFYNRSDLSAFRTRQSNLSEDEPADRLIQDRLPGRVSAYKRKKVVDRFRSSDRERESSLLSAQRKGILFSLEEDLKYSLRS